MASVQLRGASVRIAWSIVICLGLSAAATISFAEEGHTRAPSSHATTRPGGLPDRAPGAVASPSPFVSAQATPGPAAQPARRHAMYGTVTSFTPATDSTPGSLSVQPRTTASAGGADQTFQVTGQTVFREASAAQVGDGVAVAFDGTPPDGLVAMVVYIRPGGLPSGSEVWQPKPTGSEPTPSATPTHELQLSRRSNDSPDPQTVAGTLVAYIAPLDAEDGLIEVRISSTTSTGQRIESFLIPAGTQVDTGSSDATPTPGSPVALSWIQKDTQRVALSVAIN